MPAINPLFPLPLMALLFGFVFLFAYRSYKKVEKDSSQKKLLLTFRYLSLVVLLLLSLRPKMEYTEEKTQKDRLYFLYDRSASMTIKDMPGRKSRSEFIDSVLEQNKSDILKLREQFDLKEFSFASELTKDPNNTSLDNNTALGTALYETAINSKIRKVKGIVLFSDGVSNSGFSVNRAVSELKRRNIPVYSLPVGQTEYKENMVDGTISELNCPQIVKKGKSLTANIKGSIRNLNNQHTALEIYIDDKLLKTVKLQPDNSHYHFDKSVEIDTKTLTSGFKKLTAKLKTGRRELSPANNEQSLYFQIKDSGLKVLVLATSPSPNFKFASRVLTKMEDIATTIPNPFLCRTPAGQEELKNIKPEEFDVIIFLNPDINLLPLELIQKCEVVMKSRKQGLFISGEMFLKSIYQRKLLLDYLPVQLEDFSFARKTAKLNYTETAKNHFVSEFLKQNADYSLASVNGRVSSLKAAISAKVILEQDKTPILVLDELKRCRVAWLNTDGLWQWMTDPSFRQNYQQLWKRIIYHLAHREADLSASLAVFSDKTRYTLKEKVTVNADLLDEKGIPVKDAVIKFTAVPEKDDTLSLKSIFTKKSDNYVHNPLFKEGGLYTIEGHTEHNGKELKSNKIRVFIQEPKTEFENPLADEDLMAKIAKVTDGALVNSEDLPDLFKILQADSKVRSIRTVTATKDIWDNLISYLLAALFLSLEWFKRRRLGLA